MDNITTMADLSATRSRDLILRTGASSSHLESTPVWK